MSRNHDPETIVALCDDERGDVAALVVDNGPEAASAFLALAAAAVCAPLNPA